MGRDRLQRSRMHLEETRHGVRMQHAAPPGSCRLTPTLLHGWARWTRTLPMDGPGPCVLRSFSHSNLLIPARAGSLQPRCVHISNVTCSALSSYLGEPVGTHPCGDVEDRSKLLEHQHHLPESHGTTCIRRSSMGKGHWLLDERLGSADRGEQKPKLRCGVHLQGCKGSPPQGGATTTQSG